MLILFSFLLSVLIGYLFLIHYVIGLTFVGIFTLFQFFILSKDKFKNILFLLIVLFFFYPYQFFPQLNLFNFLNPFIALGLLYFIYILINKDEAKAFFKTSIIDICYLIFLIVGLIGTINTASKLGAINWLLYSFLTGFLIFKLVINSEEKKIDYLLNVFLFCGLINFAYGLFEFSQQYSFIFHESTSRFTSLLGHPLINAFVYGILLILAVQKFITSSKKYYLFLAVIFLLAVILTKSRGAWFSLLIIFLLSLFSKKIKFKYVGFFIIAAIVIAPFSHYILERLTVREDLKHSSWDVRVKSLSIGSHMLKENPLVGIGLFNTPRFKPNYTSDYLYKETSFENSFFQILVETGYLGALAYFFIIIFVLWKSFNSTNYRSYGFFTIVLFILLNSLTFNILNVYRSSHFIYWFFLGVAYLNFKTKN